MSVGVSLLLGFVGLVVIIVGSSFYTTFLTRKLILTTLKDLDTVRLTQLPPESWQRAYLKRGRKNGRIEKQDFEKQKKKNLKNLNKLIKYATTTNMMEDEQTREGVLLELKDIKRDWEAESYEDAAAHY